MIKLQLRSSDLSEDLWERVFPKALHAAPSLFYGTTNTTHHERLFLSEKCDVWLRFAVTASFIWNQSTDTQILSWQE